MRAVLRHYLDLQNKRDEQWYIDSQFGCVPQFTEDDEKFMAEFDKVAQICGYDSITHVIYGIAPTKEQAQYMTDVSKSRHIQKTERKLKYTYQTEYFEGQASDLRYLIYWYGKHNCKHLKLFRDGKLVMDR